MSHSNTRTRAYGYKFQNIRRGNMILDAKSQGIEDPEANVPEITPHKGDIGLPWAKMNEAERNTRRKEMRANSRANIVVIS